MKMPVVVFEDEQEKEYIEPAIKNDIISCIACTIEEEGFSDVPFEVCVTFTDNDEIRFINRSKRGKDSVTDVLSFPMFERDKLSEHNFSFDDYDPQSKAVLLGDIVISAERAREQSEEYGHSFRRELCFLAVHSTLHLLGYDHEISKEEEEYMFSHQNIVLEKLHITRDE